MKRVLTLVAGIALTAGLNGCCLFGHGGGGCGPCGAPGPVPFGAGFAPAAAPGNCPGGNCGYGPVGYNNGYGYSGQTAYFNGATIAPTVAAQPTLAPVATAGVDPLPTF